MQKRLYSIILLIFIGLAVQAQQEEKMGREASFRPHSRFTLMMAHYMFPHVVETETGNKNDLVPAWGVDYDYWFHPHWAIGLHSDLILQQYKIERKNDATELTRSFPVSTALVGIFKPGKHLAFVSGFGKEFEKEETLSLWNIGVEYGFELPHHWELSLNFIYEDKFHAYDSWIMGIGISKSVFGPKRH